MLTVGIDEAATARAIAAAEAHEEVFAAVGRHPNAADGLRRRRGRRDRGARPPTAGARRSARPGSTTTATARRARRSAAPSRPRSRSPAGSRLPLVIHVRDGGGDHRRRGARRDLRDPARRGRRASTVILHCFSAPPERALEARRARLVLLVRRQRHLPELRGAARGGGRRSPTSCSWSRPTRPSWRRSRCAASRTSRPTSSPPPRPSPRCAASATRELEATVEANAAPLFGW